MNLPVFTPGDEWQRNLDTPFFKPFQGSFFGTQANSITEIESMGSSAPTPESAHCALPLRAVCCARSAGVFAVIAMKMQIRENTFQGEWGELPKIYENDIAGSAAVHPREP